MIAPSLIPEIVGGVRWADIVHVTAVYNFSVLPALLITRALGKPLVWSPRGTLQRWKGSRSVLIKSAWDLACRYARPDSTILHLTTIEEASESVIRAGNPKFAIIPNGIDIPVVVPKSENSGVLRLLFLGRLDPKKGIENLIEACAILNHRGFKSWHLVIAGDGTPAYTSKLVSLAERLGVSNAIDFVGQVSGAQKGGVLSRCQAVVVPSHTENFGIVVGEALAHQRPVIASTGTPWKELEARQCGFWVSNEPESLASTILRLRVADLDAMGTQGRIWMEQSFSWKDRAAEMLAVYRRLAGRPPRCETISDSGRQTGDKISV